MTKLKFVGKVFQVSMAVYALYYVGALEPLLDGLGMIARGSAQVCFEGTTVGKVWTGVVTHFTSGQGMVTKGYGTYQSGAVADAYQKILNGFGR